ncbi:MAG: non-histone chromosomal MC1 family protein [Euryarchaeota archaeon]|nr:MAG: Chromosomal protein MC1 [ANME-2 cluster archaeon]MEA1863868.1 non-histone chromosomal MC1 family protein [Euryarchaeota archaeon]
MDKTRNFVLRDVDGSEHGVFSGKQPRQAALKVANRIGGDKTEPLRILLRERGTKKIHVFDGWREQVNAPKNKPDWMPDKIWKPNVRKIGIESLD